MSGAWRKDARWRNALADWIREHSGQLGLRADRLQIDEVVNPSGWLGNVACTVTNGTSRLHIKLTQEREDLRKVFELRDRLSSRYHAPTILAWIDLGDLVGICMPSLPAKPATELLIPDLIAIANELHGDLELAEALPKQSATLRQAFLNLWIDRFTSDLAELKTEGMIPPFVTTEAFEWMQKEISRLARMTYPGAFDEPAVSPVHGDLHFGNVLVEQDGCWWIIDWEDLHCGDPAVHLSILLAPLLARGDPVEHLLGDRDKAFKQRFVLCARAVLLDDIIDSLTSWARADDAPSAAKAIRIAKRATHERAMQIYRGRYSG